MTDIIGAYQYGLVLNDLHKTWQPHAGQIPIGHALFYEMCKNIFATCGRNFGKTDLAGYSSWRWALTNPGTENYIFEPFANQAREILWASNRIQQFGPEKYIEDINTVEMRITFINKSFIKLDGSDNYDARRGIKPRGLIIYDEFKDHRKEFIDAFEPNRAAHNNPALFLGTPPEVENHFVTTMNIARKAKHWRFFHAPSSTNPHLSKEWLSNKRQEYLDSGDEETWLREYEAIFIKGGKRHIIPQALRLQPKPIQKIVDGVKKGIHHWQLFTIFDPAAASTFAVLFVLFNPFTKKMIIVDEIYEQTQEFMTTEAIWAAAVPKINFWKHHGVSEFRFIYDEAETWFMNESYDKPISQKFDLEPTQKSRWDKGSGIAMIREVCTDGLVEVSNQCPKFMWELENYIKDDKGRIPKLNDHLIDDWRYFLDAAGFNKNTVSIPKAKDKDLEPRFKRLEDELELDPLRSFDEEMYQPSNETFFEEI